MADSAKREKIAAARKKLKQFQKSGKNNKARDSTGSPKPKVAKDKISEDLGKSEKNSSKVSKTDSATINSADQVNSREDNHSVINCEVPDIKASGDHTQNTVGEVVVDISKTSQPEIIAEASVTNTRETLQNSTSPAPAAQSENGSQFQDSYMNRVTSPGPRIDTLSSESNRSTKNMDSRPTASTESLQQLSRQINGILAESPVGFEVEPNHSDILELETRNRDLAALLAQHVQNNEQLTLQNEQIRQHALGVQSHLDQERSDHQQRLSKELGPLKEQLQVHIQTIGILVAEKTELQSHLAQSQKIGEQRFSEVEDLTGRLKTSKQRTADLERSLSTSNTSSQKLEQSSKDSAKEIDKLKLDLFKLNKSHEELKQNTSEVQEKLKSKTSECSGFQHSVTDLQRRLEMAELYNQQLSNQNDTGRETLQIVEQLQQERDSFSSQFQQVSESLQRVTVEKEQLTDQYKQYMEQLHGQNTQLTNQVTSLTEEREGLVNQTHNMEATVVELQRKLEDVATQPVAPVVDEHAHEELLQDLGKIQTEYSELSQRHDAQIRDNSQLSRLLGEKEGKILELETKLEELSDVAGDKEELLENIQSDKTALSRALTQNKDLKIQLAELQNGFVKMSNDNMEMLTQLQTEQHASRDIQVKLASQEEELKKYHEALSQRDAELQVAIENSAEANKVKLLHEQIQDRLRHYEAQAQLVETLQKELHSAQDMSEALTAQNSELRTMLIRATETKVLNPDANVENAQREDVIDSLQATIGQLELERNQLIDNLNKQRDLTDHLGVKVSDLEEEIVQQNSSNAEGEHVSRHEHEKLKNAMEMIQDKYNRVMRDKADLCDKADELEHMVLQLQGETETIGEYISLYHHQRALLQQREIQKNEYIKQLAKDREELQDKLGELQTLVMQLMGEKNMLHSYQQESVRPQSPNIHSPINTLPTNDRHTEWPDYTSSESDTESEVETIIGGKDGVHVEKDGAHVPMDAHMPTEETLDPVSNVQNMVNQMHNINRDMLVNGHGSEDDRSTDDHMHLDNHGHGDHHHGIHGEHASSARSRSHSKQDSGGHEEVTANKILNLLSEIGHSSFVDNMTFMEKQFHPCKYCKGRLQIL